MFKLILSWRYLRTRYIALASIISVTLGVATLIVVNSVMAGFSLEMHRRLHGVLSDLIFESVSLGGLPDPQWHKEEIAQVLGDDLAGITATVQVPAMLSFQVRGQWITRQVNLIGIDQNTYANVGDFSQYLLHPENCRHLSFQLRENGYDERLPPSGWEQRRLRVEYERAFQQQLRHVEASRRAAVGEPLASDELSTVAPPSDPYGLRYIFKRPLTSPSGWQCRPGKPALPKNPFFRGKLTLTVRAKSKIFCVAGQLQTDSLCVFSFILQ